jgi:enoyl-CoA hydratase/carnithine racemase
VETLLVEREGGVVTVTMNRPERRNAANGTMIQELRTCFDEVERRADDRVLVLTGAGEAFCSGLDLTGDRGDPGGEPASPMARMRRLARAASALHRLSKPTIAKVDGVAYGAGFGLALGCDLVVVSDRARLATFFSRRALSVDTGMSWLLPRLVGIAVAKELVLFGDELDVHRAEQMGLVNRVVPSSELDAFVAGWAQRLVQGPTLALSLSKSLIDGSGPLAFDQALDSEAHCQVVNFSSADAAEALAAYTERRDPHFIGR